ncbi:hypothetical protein Q1695_003817 [Nippostrongylus brasiliensis]|nr:hypothetical protein Q1695_003817 [Nippostrongylus brasiliensis]
MVNLQLFVVVLASFFWDGQALECAYREQSEQFCLHVNESYQLNNSSEHLFTGDKFKDDRERISRANEKVLAVLKLSKKSAVKKALCSALESETTAVFSAGVSCSGSEKTTDACELGLTGRQLSNKEQVTMRILFLLVLISSVVQVRASDKPILDKEQCELVLFECFYVTCTKYVETRQQNPNYFACVQSCIGDDMPCVEKIHEDEDEMEIEVVTAFQ